MTRLSQLTVVLLLSCCSSVFAQAPAGAPGAGQPGQQPSGGPRQGNHPCKADAQKFCAGVQPGQGRIIACLKQHAAELSPACKSGMEQRQSKPPVK